MKWLGLSTAISTLFVCLSCWRGQSLWAQPNNADVLQSPSQQKSFSADFNRVATFPVVSNGYLLSFSRSVNHPDPSKGIFVTSLSGAVSHTIPFWIPGAVAIHLDSAAVEPTGTVLIGGSYLRSDDPDDIRNFKFDPSTSGARNFIAEIDQAGNVVALHDLLDYAPERLCSSDDGSYWVFGQMWSNGAESSVPSDYLMLRHYDSSGNNINSYLHRSQIEMSGTPTFRAKGHNARTAFMLCGRDSAAIYVQQQLGMLWTLVNAKTGQVESRRVKNPMPGMVPTGLAWTDETHIFASFRTVQVGTQLVPEFGPSLGIYELNGSSAPASWEPIRNPDGSTNQSTLLGNDGAFVLYLKGPELPPHDPTLYWSSVGK